MDIESLGGNWYALYGGKDSLEYNTGLNPTAKLHADRKPHASVFRHIDGNRVVARIEGKPEQSFPYKKYGYQNAHAEAKHHVEKFFKETSAQKDIFNTVWSAD